LELMENLVWMDLAMEETNSRQADSSRKPAT